MTSGERVRQRGGDKQEHTLTGNAGTTQNQAEGWIIGQTPDLRTGVWVGCEDRAAHFRTIVEGQGASMALPIFGLYMQQVYADKSVGISTGPFERPEGELTVELDCRKYDRLNSNTQGGRYDPGFE